MNPRVALASIVAAAVVLGGVLVIALSRDEQNAAPPTAATGYAGALLPRGVRAPDFRLRDDRGRAISMRGFRGRPVLVTFLYTTCKESCPGMAQTARGALDDLGHDVPAIAIAVDPPRDTPARARAFLAKQQALGRLRFVLGTRAQLRPLWKGYAIQPQSVAQEHQARFVIVDKRGYQRIGFPGQEATPDRLAHDLRLLERQ
ncbi:MAG: SCO family protein [Thermoleophilaceae bacterium]